MNVNGAIAVEIPNGASAPAITTLPGTVCALAANALTSVRYQSSVPVLRRAVRHLVRLVPGLPVADARQPGGRARVAPNRREREGPVLRRVGARGAVDRLQRPGRRARDVDDRLEPVRADQAKLRVECRPVVGGIGRGRWAGTRAAA